jgi:hypothetical protein
MPLSSSDDLPHQVLYAAELLGIDPFEHPELMFLAEEALFLELPLGWAPVETAREPGVPEGGTYFYSSVLTLSQWLHPKLTYLVALARAYGAPDAANNEDIEKD